MATIENEPYYGIIQHSNGKTINRPYYDHRGSMAAKNRSQIIDSVTQELGITKNDMETIDIKSRLDAFLREIKINNILSI